MEDNADLKKACSILVRFLVYGGALLAIAKIIESDMTKQSIKENSLVEISQELIVLFTAIVAGVTGFRYAQIRTAAYVFAAIAVVSLIRELDGFLETHLFEYAWQLFAFCVVLPTLWFVFRNLSRFVSQISHLSNTFAFGLLFSGTLVVHVFSRLLGRAVIWEALMTEEKYIRSVKDVAEEGIELLGYTIILMGTIELFLLCLPYPNDPLE